MIASNPTTHRVKERDDADWCRHCGRPTWSLRRCCVRCKRSGLTGRGSVASRYARISDPRLGFAFVCYWFAHVAVSVLSAHLILGGLGAVPPNGFFAAVLLFGLLEATLEGCGFLLAVLISPRPAHDLRLRYYLLAAGLGATCAVVSNALLLNGGQGFPLPRVGAVVAMLIAFSAVITRIVMGCGLASHTMHPDRRDHCPECGYDLSFDGDVECPQCLHVLN